MIVAYLAPSAQLGGAERCLMGMLESLIAAHPTLRLHLIVPGDGPLVAKARLSGIEVTVLRFPPAIARLGERFQTFGFWRRAFRVAVAAGSALSYTRVMRRTLQRMKPQVVHAHGNKMLVLGAWSRPCGASLIWHLHDYLAGRPLTAGLLRRNAKACDLAIAVSDSVRHDLRRVCPGISAITIHNRIDLQQFSPAGVHADLDLLCGLPPAPPGIVKVGLVATMAPWKGHRIFLQAVATLAGHHPIRAYVIGGAVYQTAGREESLDALRRLSRELQLESTVGFTGFLEDTASAMRSLDIVVHASTEPEPFGLAVIEAMACGRPVVVSRTGGVTELFREGETALSYSPGDVPELAEVLVHLVADQQLRADVGARARRWAERKFDRNGLGDVLETVYRELAGPETADVTA